MKNLKFNYCTHCKNLTITGYDAKVPMTCCGENMIALEANSQDGAGEKHLPVVTVTGNKYEVKVGEVAHPMVDAHYISFVLLELEDGFLIKYLEPNQEPKAVFETNEKVLAAYEYCNVHGLYKVTL